ncbi:MAG: folylpolyglutamate synthase/dihydrofolate synthase family protein [Bacteroidota bacterium]
MNYKEVLAYMFSQLPMYQRIGAAAYKADLNNTIQLLHLLGNPERAFRSVHIAGTNGKGSVSHYLASVFQEAGYKTALYTSPHLKDFRERIKINGEMIPKWEVSRFINAHQADFERLQPSFFEMTVGLAFDYFRNQKVDIAIIETGMGGRLDSTNVIQPEVSVITNIGLDHTQFLGNTFAEIATEKAGIIKAKTPVVLGEKQAETEAIFRAMAAKLEASIVFTNEHFSIQQCLQKENLCCDVYLNNDLYLKNLYSELKGVYQLKNMLTVLQTLEVLKHRGFNINEDSIRKGFAKVIQLTGLLGRFQQLGDQPLVIADTAHNEAGLRIVLKQFYSLAHKEMRFVLGMVNDKDIKKMLRMFPVHAHYYFCKPDIPRGLDAEVLAKEAKDVGLIGRVFSSVKKALRVARLDADTDDIIYVGGSTFVVAEVV